METDDVSTFSVNQRNNERILDTNASMTSEESDFEMDDVPPFIQQKKIPEKKNETDLISFMQKLESRATSVKTSSAYEIFRMYEDLLTTLPKSTKPAEVADTLLQPCCQSMCCLKFSPIFVMRARLLTPVSSSEDESLFDKVQQFQFFLIRNCVSDERFLPKIHETPVCEEFFIRLYAIPKNRFERLTSQIFAGFTNPLPHGNQGNSFEHSSTSVRFAKLINTIDTMAEPNPSDTSYLLPAGMTKSDLIQHAEFNVNVKINPKQEIDRLDQTFRFQKANSFNKCNICIKLKLAKTNPSLTFIEREEAKIHLDNHRKNITEDRRDYCIRKLTSLEEPNSLLSIAHDGMSKHKTKFPHLLNFNLKKLSDAMKMMCSLNLAVVHKKTDDTSYQLHCFWNIDQISGARANAVISQLFYSISHSASIPTNIAIQLDNCGANKCYTLFGAFGLLLLWIPKLTNIYICTSEVGHTHNDVDQTFGILAKALNKEEVFTPQGYTRFAEKKLKGILTNNLLPTTYDFESVVKPIVHQNGQIYNNHYFELSKSSTNEVTLKIARFLRSQKYLSNDKNEPLVFNMFKEVPILTNFPEPIPPNEINTDKHQKLCEAVKGSIQPDDYKELLHLPQFVKNNYQSEAFENLLTRISEKVIPPSINVEVPNDPDNELVDQYLNKIQKVWQSEITDNPIPSTPTVAVELEVPKTTKQNLKSKKSVPSTSSTKSTTKSATKRQTKK